MANIINLSWIRSFANGSRKQRLKNWKEENHAPTYIWIIFNHKEW